MKTNKTGAFIGLFVGIALIAVMVVLRNTLTKPLSGVILGIGAGMIGMSLARLLTIRWYQKHPAEFRQAAIENRDERNLQIHNMARAKAGEILQWMVIALAFLSILRDEPLWVTLLIVLIFVAYQVINVGYIIYYTRRM